MKRRKYIRIFLFVAFTALLLFAGYGLFVRLLNAKEVYRSELENFIPETVESVLVVHRKGEDIAPLMGELKTIAQMLYPDFIYPVYFLNQNGSSAILFKYTLDNERKIKETLQSLKSQYKTKEMPYKGVSILFFPDENNRFLLCFFHQGAFACSHNYKMLQNIIDAEPDKTFFTEDGFSKLIDRAANNFIGNIYTRSRSNHAVYNIIKSDSAYFIEGWTDYSPKNLPSGKIQINYQLLPDQTIAFETVTGVTQINPSERSLFLMPQFSVQMTDSLKSKVTILRFSGSRFRLFDHLNAIEQRLTGNSIQMQDALARNTGNIYAASERFNSYFFESPHPCYFSFQNDCFVFSTQVEHLRLYLQSAKGNPPFVDLCSHILETCSDSCSAFYFGYNQCSFVTSIPMLNEINIAPDTYSYMFSVPVQEMVKQEMYIKLK